jgi:nucleotide-binding universal stress UspA family protein
MCIAILKRQEGYMYKNILAPLDGSELSECSLDHVTAIAKGCQVPNVVLLHVLEPHDRYAGYTGISTEMLEDIRKQFQTQNKEYLDKVADKLKKKRVKRQDSHSRGQAKRGDTKLRPKEPGRPDYYEHPRQLRPFALGLWQRG